MPVALYIVTLAIVGLIARRAERPWVSPVVVAALADLGLTEIAPQLMGGAHPLWRVLASGIVIVGAVVAMPRPRRAAPLPAPVRDITEVGPPAARPQPTPLLVRAPAPEPPAAPSSGPPAPEDTPVRVDPDEETLPFTQPSLPAVSGGVLPFKGPSHGRISAARLRDAIAHSVTEGVSTRHVELPGFGVFSRRTRRGASTLAFHDDSEVSLALGGTAFADAVAQRLECSPTTAGKACTKFFTALRAAVVDGNAQIEVDGLGRFGVRRGPPRDRLQFEPPSDR